MKKIIALFLSVLMLLSTLAACGKDPATQKETEPKGDGEKITLTIGIPKSTLVQDYYQNHYTKWLEEKTGYNIEFQFFSAGVTDYKTQLSTMVAGKVAMPDILYNFDLGADLHNRYGRDGVLVDLSPYFNDREKSAIWWERFEQLDPDQQRNIWLRMQSSDGDGSIYGFPEIQESAIDVMDYQVWINQEWLDALDLPMPTDPDSLYNVLKAFKERDPNGNGLPDEIPLVGTANTLSGQTMHWLINMFIYEDDDTSFNVDENGKLYSPYREDAYRDALKYIRKLYKEGLLSPLTLTAAGSDLRQMVCPADGGEHLAGVVCGHLTICFVQDHEGILAYEPLPIWGNALFHENGNNYSTFITSSCEERGNVDAAWNLLMLMATEESSLIQRYGIQGEDWDYAEEGSTSVLGTPAKIRLYRDTWGTIGNQNWRNIEATILFNAEGEGNQAVPEDETPVRQHKYDLFNAALDNYHRQIENYNPPEELICPILIWPTEYKEELPLAPDDCKVYINKSRTDFITGNLDINSDKDWQDYLDHLDKLGYDQWLFYSQALYDEYMATQS